MLVYQTSKEVDPKKCFLCKPISNKFPNYISFYKLSYNLFSFTLNSLLIWVDLKYFNIKEQAGHCVIYYTLDDDFMDRMIQFERSILMSLNISLQKKIQLTSYENKNAFFSNKKIGDFRLFIRISGVWESETHIGLTSKIDIYPST